MVRHSALISMFKIVIALLAALVFVGIGGVTVSAGAHDCGCQTDNSGPGSSGPDNSGPGNACHDNSGPGSTTSGSDNSGSDNSGSDNSGSDNSGSNSGPGSGDECPPDDPGDDPGDSGDNPGDSNDTGATSGGTVVQGAQASVRSSSPTQAGAEVPTAVSAGLTGADSEESPSVLAGLAILLGLTMTIAAVARRRTRA
jgi:hypothetical protein